MTTHEPTRLPPSPSDSVLMGLARAAMAPGTGLDELTWPRLDFSDPAQRTFGDYELLEEIGRGGMGVVYRARQKSLEREVAIKFIAAGIADSVNVARFLGEARAAARLMHPNIVPVYEVGSTEGVHYFSMPLVRGRSLATVLEAGTMAPATAVALMLKLCDAIDYAHRLGLLHLDLKPANVLLDEREEPLVADFGLARHMDPRGGVDAQEVSGTPSFMAPEQILIKQYRLTPATDIYALGAMLYRALVGVSPHGEGKADDVIRRAAAGRIRPPRELHPTVPRDLDAICMKCLELQPADRYASVALLGDDLRRVRDGLPVSVRRIGTLERAQRWFRREPRLAIAASVAVLALLIGGAATSWQWREAVAQRDAALEAQREATLERDRAKVAGEIGARLFAYEGEEDEQANDLLTWLGERFPGDEDRQADALSAFAGSLSGGETARSEEMLVKIVEVLGVDYRKKVVEALRAGQDPRRHLYAALLTWRDTRSDAAEAEYAVTLQSAVDAQPDDPLVWQVAAIYCPGGQCLNPDATERLTRLDGDNMYAWVLHAIHLRGGQGWREALHEAAKRTRFDDYLGANYAAFGKAVEVAAVPVPVLLARPIAVLAPGDKPHSVIGLYEAHSAVALTGYGSLVRLCGVMAGAEPPSDPQASADCLVIGKAMMRSRSSLISNMIGVAMLRTLAKGTPLAEEALQTRRLYSYLSSAFNELSAAKRFSYPSARYVRDMSSEGEMVALQHAVTFFGIPDQPPADWQPEDPTGLLSSRERKDLWMGLDRDSRGMVAQGKYGEALALLEKSETGWGKAEQFDWLRARYLTTRGRAHIGLGEYAPAKAALDAACDTGVDFPPSSREARDCMQAQIDLYAAWQRSEPGHGHDGDARDWLDKLNQLDLEAAQ